jgi:hypothetical protein
MDHSKQTAIAKSCGLPLRVNFGPFSLSLRMSAVHPKAVVIEGDPDATLQGPSALIGRALRPSRNYLATPAPANPSSIPAAKRLPRVDTAA